MRVVLVDFSFIYAIVLSLLWVSSSIISRSNAASSLLNDPFYGISPQDENYYKTSSNTIKCKDGSKKFSITQLNDDFCDCPDGTDEPGTSACPNGKFYCQNAGHSPLVIFSSRVNDGICDCCDGRDEYDGKIKCRNTCWEAGKVARDKLRKKIATYLEGVVLRKKEIEQAKQSLVNDEAELSKLKNEEKILKGLVQQLKERKEQIEKAEEKERLQREKEKKEAEEKTQKYESEFGEKAKQGKNEAEENAHSEDKLAESHDDEVGVSEESYLDQAKAEDHVDEEPATEAKHTVIPEKGTPVNVMEQAKAKDHVDEEPATEAKHTVIPEKGTPVNHAAEETKQSVSPKGKDGSAAVSETSLNAESQVPREEEKNVEDSASENTELSREELGRLVASRWTGEKNEKQSGEGGAKDNDQGHEEMPEYNHDGEEDGYATDTDDDSERYDSEKYDDNDMEDEIDETYREEDHHDTSTSSKSDIDDYLDLSETKSPSSPTWLEKIKQTVRNILQTVNLFQTPVDKSEAAGIRKEYDESSDKLSKIQSRISSLAQKLKQDFGPEKEFYSFYGHCFESKQNKYVYKVCPYKKATQEEEHTTTRLGSWDKFEDSYRIMLFSNGDKCWNGPDRSMKVRLRCGLKNEVADVDEPSRCEYVALLSTPAVCLEEKLQELQRKLDELNKEQPQRHDEL